MSDTLKQRNSKKKKVGHLLAAKKFFSQDLSHNSHLKHVNIKQIMMWNDIAELHEIIPDMFHYVGLIKFENTKAR